MKRGVAKRLTLGSQSHDDGGVKRWSGALWHGWDAWQLIRAIVAVSVKPGRQKPRRCLLCLRGLLCAGAPVVKGGGHVAD